MGIFDSIVGGYFEGKYQAKVQANNHLQSMSDNIEIMERVCNNTSSCSYCSYGTSPTACEYHASIELFNETLEDYARKGLVKRG